MVYYSLLQGFQTRVAICPVSVGFSPTPARVIKLHNDREGRVHCSSQALLTERAVQCNCTLGSSEANADTPAGKTVKGDYF